MFAVAAFSTLFLQPFEVLIIGIGHWDIPYLYPGDASLTIFYANISRPSILDERSPGLDTGYCKVLYIFNQESTINQPLKDLLKLIQINSVEWPSSSVGHRRCCSDFVQATSGCTIDSRHLLSRFVNSRILGESGAGDSGDSQTIDGITKIRLPSFHLVIMTVTPPSSPHDTKSMRSIFAPNPPLQNTKFKKYPCKE